MKYVFVLGRNPKMSLVEIKCYFDSKDCNYDILYYTEDIALIDFDGGFDPEVSINDLGGIKKICEVIIESDLNDISNDIREENIVLHMNNKFFYGLSSFGDKDDKILHKVRQELKEKFKELGYIAMYKHQLSPKYIVRKNILDEGLDLTTFEWNNKVYLARTCAVYNPQERKKRDEERPEKDYMISLSIRIAKILLNMSGSSDGDKVLDPFCGIGTVLQEAMMMGCEAYGIDIDEENIEKTKRNVNWIKSEYGLKNKFTVKQGNSETLSSIYDEKFDAIVTEPFLGPFVGGDIETEKAKEVIADLEELYSKVFHEAEKVLKPGGRMVIVLPEFYTSNGASVGLDGVKLTGDTNLDLLESIEKELDIELPLEYEEDWHNIRRNIYVFENTT